MLQLRKLRVTRHLEGLLELRDPYRRTVYRQRDPSPLRSPFQDFVAECRNDTNYWFTLVSANL